MNKLLLFIVGLFLILYPFYIFDSGVPQPAHYLALIGIVILPFTKGFRSLFKEKVVRYLLWFILLVILINTSYFFVHFKEDGFMSPFLIHTAYYIYNFGFFLLILHVLRKEDYSKVNNTIVLFLLLSLVLQFILAVVGVNKVTQYIVTERMVIFFNNPNQLGYYVLLVVSLFAIVPSKFRSNKCIVLGVIIASISLGVFSSSRIVLLGLFLLTGILMYQLGIQVKYWIVIGLVGVLIASIMYKTEYVQKKIELIEIRNHRQDTTGVSEFQIRGYDRIVLHPNYLLVGAGEGKYDRFSSYQKGELHSGFGTILFAYGIIGLVLFLVFFFSAIKFNFFYNLLLLSPILIYNFVHQGIRNPLFWALLAVIFLINNKQK
ncbi:O-antigen ligase family protein [Ulvibacter litoralis]|uniref:O-Antigen ligase n=1 Tax=Ulvibacter litoralis TaxID=227084 RepID=A0A1G7HM21_9FLAO|nr:hypothetical protein [Ulvibacter litoralis]GHC58347.1 hypothetical protein GCM10008083_23860 [Ulvibacter litoralis]SDF01512.1 hypothetical protein SAMN05421855_104175 [Ulvibacter litoralis]